MNDINLYATELKAANGEKSKFVYETNEDMLDIFFGKSLPATGVELTDHIFLRLNRTTGKAVSLTIRHFSILTERTEYGIRSYLLDKLEELPEDLRELAVNVVTTDPINKSISKIIIFSSLSREACSFYFC